MVLIFNWKAFINIEYDLPEGNVFNTEEDYIDTAVRLLSLMSCACPSSTAAFYAYRTTFHLHSYFQQDAVFRCTRLLATTILQQAALVHHSS